MQFLYFGIEIVIWAGMTIVGTVDVFVIALCDIK